MGMESVVRLVRCLPTEQTGPYNFIPRAVVTALVSDFQGECAIYRRRHRKCTCHFGAFRCPYVLDEEVVGKLSHGVFVHEIADNIVLSLSRLFWYPQWPGHLY